MIQSGAKPLSVSPGDPFSNSSNPEWSRPIESSAALASMPSLSTSFLFCLRKHSRGVQALGYSGCVLSFYAQGFTAIRLLELRQEPQVAALQLPDVIDPVTHHSQAS